MKIGSLIAYLNVGLNLVVNFFLIPFMLQHLGASEYGVYKIVQSFTGQLAIMSFGLATVAARYIVVYNTQNKIKEKKNFLFLIYSISAILSIAVMAIGAILYSFIDKIYASSLTPFEIDTAKKLCIVFVLNVALSIFSDSFTGIIRAYERFVISNSISIARLVLRVISIVALLSLGYKSLSVVLIDLSITILALCFSIAYVKIVLKEKAKYYIVDKKLLREIATFAFAVFLQAIVNQVNQNLDNTVLGIMTDTSTVTVYSVALTLYTCFMSLVTALSSMFGPKATKLVANGASGEELTDFVIKPGRIQTMVALLGVFGFAIVGKDFIQIWMGKGFDEVYIITLILIVPAIIPSIESVTSTLLDAMLKRMARSLALIGMCIINIVSSVFFIKIFGFIGAAFGTALSIFLGHGIVINLYLHKKIGLNIPVMFRKIFRGILPAFMVCLIVGISISFIPGGSITLFLLKSTLSVLVYAVIMYFIGMNETEKRYCRHFFKKA